MGVKYLWDTNIAIYYLQQQFPLSSEEFIDLIISEESPVISVISEIELLCWKTASEKDNEVLREFINDSIVIELETAIKLKTAELRKLYRIKLPDAIIAATALVYELTLVTRNIEDFKNIANLNLIDPWNL
ncbi:MAG: type II toxin-antitoxin system VapC family toxin [Prolixibacteraceae bacterium]|nr:type II toxin-antitoxin system VapC family toxin [Prolixibacteraceae bacterium]